MAVSEPVTPAPKVVAGFWIRVVADVIDMTILWGFALVLSSLMESWFVKLGENGVWVGLLVSIAYFVPMQSRFGNGQSLGKRALRIQVLTLSGQPLSLIQSFLRYLVIAYVAYNGVFTGVVNSIVGSSLSIFFDSIMGVLWFMALVGCYLLIPLHPLKRGLHDLVAGSMVVYRDRFSAPALAALNNPAKARMAFVIVGVTSAITIGVAIFGLRAIPKYVSLAYLQELQTKLESTGKFQWTSVNDNTFSSGSGTTRSIIVQAHVEGPLDQTREDLKTSYDLAFETIREQIKDLSPYDNLRVGLRLGYNLGIRKRYTTMFEDENPSKPGERKYAGFNINF